MVSEPPLRQVLDPGFLWVTQSELRTGSVRRDLMAIRKPEKGQLPVFVWSLGTHTLRKTSVTVTHLESSKKIRKIPDDF